MDTKISYENTDLEQTNTIHEKTSQIQFFENTEQKYTLHLTDQADFVYALFLKNAKIQLSIITKQPQVKAKIFAFLPATEKSTSSLHIETLFQSSESSVTMHLIAIQGEDAKVHMQGKIDINTGIEKVSGHLLEEVILLGNTKYTSLQPILNVASPDVQASHGAKIHKISPEKLFYMQSKGLSSQLATNMIIQGYVQHILGHFTLDSQQQQNIYSFIS